MNYIELKISVTPKEAGSEILIAELSEVGFESFVDTAEGFIAYIPNTAFDENSLNSITANYATLFSISSTISIIEQQNWNKEWESNFQPIDVDGKCLIRAPFHESKKNYLFDIIIEPKMSFGTGHHHTTQLMIKKLLQLPVSGKSLLDMGCGTGVLAILAAQLNANPITAIDIDDWSYENSIENLQKNNINNVLVQKGDVQLLAGKVFHTILANINKNVLLADIPVYSEAIEKNGNLVLSGFFDTDIEELTNKAMPHNLKLVDQLSDNQWTMLHFIKL